MRFSVWMVAALLGCTEHGSTSKSDGAPSIDAPFPDDASLFDTLPDAASCLDDSAFEPNNSIATAFATPVAAQAQMFTALASICPAGDKDTYSVTLSTTSALRVTTSWTSGDPVTSSILNAGGTALANSLANGATSHCACLKNLPAGTFFAQLSAATGVQNDYQVEIKIIANSQCTAPPACN